MATLADVAALAGVSKSTASRVLSENGYASRTTKALVRSAAVELGYVPSTSAASLVTGRTRGIGVVTPAITPWFYSQVIEGVEATLIEAGYDLTLFQVQESATHRRRVFDYFLQRKAVDGVITVAVRLDETETATLQALGKPIVAVGGRVLDMGSVSIDDEQAGWLATRHLISLGHRRIMHFGGDERQVPHDFEVPRLRARGFRRAVDQLSGRMPDDFLGMRFRVSDGHRAALSVLGDPRRRPTAIFAACDEIAIGVLLAARELGIRVPDELSVIGIDDHELAEVMRLTTIRQSPKQQGQAAVQVLLHALHQGELRDLRMPLELIVRGTTTAPRAPASTGAG